MQANLPPPSNPPQNSRGTEQTFTGAQYSASEVQTTEGRKHLRDRLGFQGGSQTPASARKRGKSPQVFSYGQAINGGLSTTGNTNMETAKVLAHRKTHGGARTVATIVDNSGEVPHLKSHSKFVSSKHHSHEPISSSGETDSTVVFSRMLEDACCRNAAEEKVLCFQCSRYHHVHNMDSLIAIFATESR